MVCSLLVRPCWPLAGSCTCASVLAPPCQMMRIWQVRPHGMEGVEGHHGAVQVHRPQELGEMAGLVVLDIDLDMIQQPPAVLGDAEQVDPGAVGAAGSARGLTVHTTARSRLRASILARRAARRAR